MVYVLFAMFDFLILALELIFFHAELILLFFGEVFKLEHMGWFNLTREISVKLLWRVVLLLVGRGGR
ncbi:MULTISPECIES: hypothetical protein [Pseudomonas]|uniref:hypothetical protein n=1 Tax=Pseudomonas TaxID=286 RepID=UPI001FF2701D|nr:hypothetical protein [Pseudomonas sp. YL2]